ncbi:carbon-monoxide dehydrogenase medium subunit [Aromatoleum tolulyticum]|uniref:Carbon-monoxide dehydrogenase medium subunit n=1 Tax=Aromatoleum tolulyticum TaxID=34027 RepID=A0A1N6PG96_9RHOO|nr:FAD binding domain-containing protein [Aromatoleum tolulyticum]SIQ03361.1 carbon-monoxide dehydrogenase medium subunit [Aromatoleum tolulyticum]
MSSRILPDFDLLLPQSVAEAVELLSTHRDRITVMAGGTDVMVAMKFAQSPAQLMSLENVPGLAYVLFDPEKGLRIGAKATVADLLAQAEVKRHYRALWHAAQTFATGQVRNTATVLGNLLRASPAGDCSCAIYAIGGVVVLQGSSGRREVDIDDFWLSYGVTARRPDELAVELILPPPAAGSRSAFKRMTRVSEDLAKLNVAVRLEMSGNTCIDARLAMGCVAPTPLRLTRTETLLKGRELTAEVLQRVAASVQWEISPIDDKRSTAEYRKQVSGVLLKRAIQEACGAA